MPVETDRLYWHGTARTDHQIRDVYTSRLHRHASRDGSSPLTRIHKSAPPACQPSRLPCQSSRLACQQRRIVSTGMELPGPTSDGDSTSQYWLTGTLIAVVMILINHHTTSEDVCKQVCILGQTLIQCKIAPTRVWPRSLKTVVITTPPANFDWWQGFSNVH